MAAVGFQELPGAIGAYLNRGASPEALDEALYQAGVASVPVSVRAGDVTGDGKTDMVVSIFDPTSGVPLPGGKLLIFVCARGAYELGFERDSAEGFGPPHLWYLQDLGADGSAELVISEAICGAHTCFDDVQVLSWEGGVVENRLEGSTLDLPSPDVRISDADGDGVYDLEVVSGGVGSVGAGPQREVSRVWRLAPEAGRWVMDREVMGSSGYRIHALHDAEDAARGGDYERALVLYQQVVSDSTLADWTDPAVEQAYLGAYARYKMMAIYLLEGQADFADTVYAAMQADYPQGSDQRAYVEMAEAFRDGFAGGGEAGGCAAAAVYAAGHSQAVLDPLGPARFGYANREFTAEDVCP